MNVAKWLHLKRPLKQAMRLPPPDGQKITQAAPLVKAELVHVLLVRMYQLQALVDLQHHIPNKTQRPSN